MGVGDWIIATGQVKDMYAKNGGVPILIVSRDFRVQWQSIFEGNPKIAREAKGKFQRLINAGGNRPYIHSKTPRQWHWKSLKPTPGEIYLTADEKAFAEPYRGRILIEPNVKANGHDNKAWIWERWQEVADRWQGAKLVQTGSTGCRGLRGVEQVETESFRKAAAVLSVCRAFVGTEGGLMHAAAALGVPAVILWSEFIHPDITGYESMRNIRHASKVCGMRVPCPGCSASMRRITTDEVLKELGAIA